MPALTNHPTLEHIRTLPIGEIAALPAEHLAILQQDASASLKSAKTVAEWLDGAITMRFGERAQTLRRESGKDTGTVRFEDEGVSVDADLPKRVDWDQSQLAALVERIRADGDDPSQYVDIAFKVPERKYSAWPNHIRTKFEPARTVKTGKPSITLSLNRTFNAPPEVQASFKGGASLAIPQIGTISATGFQLSLVNPDTQNTVAGNASWSAEGY